MSLRPPYELLETESFIPREPNGPQHTQFRHDDDQTYNFRLFRWACIGAICSSALSVIIFASQVFVTSHVKVPLHESVLHRPSHYMNLENILRNTNHSFPPITNFPQVVLQISNNDSLRRMAEDDRGHPTSIGAVYPDDRHVLVTSQTSTILHFRHQDFAFESCMLNFEPLARTDSFDPQVKLGSSNHVDIWVLDSSTEISRHIGNSWKFAPRRRHKLVTMEISQQDSIASGHFHCPTNQFTTLELACSPSPSISSCDVDFWQDQRVNPRGGIFLIQSFTGID
ncbi:hypothetical protein H2248_009971 [Termitomyces sp. 'cryptogamus']|nr:hypothetical protein H2248_009971 [Termitomyces sp. 'cryptogamus']